MSVDIAGDPWKFAQDGVGTNPVNFKYYGPVALRDGMITKVANVGDRIYFTDWSGRTILDYTAQAASETFRISKINSFLGLKCVQFDSGEITMSI